MLSFVLKRLAVVVPTFLGVTLITFSLIRLAPGDPVELLAGERGIDPARHAQMRAELGLDQPLAVQYVRYVWQLVHGDLGHSIVSKEAVLSEFLTLFPATIELAVCAVAFAVVLGLPAGVIAATRRGTAVDHTIMGVSLTGYSMPLFWWALLLIMLCSVTLGLTPVSGRISVIYYFEPVTGFMLVDSWLSGQAGAFGSAARHLALPTVVLGTIPLAAVARMTRSAMLEALGQDYVRAARARGVPRFQVVTVHALRNALIPVVTVIGLQIGVLLSGAILTETIFSWPGIGKWLIDSIARRDYPAVQGGVLLVAAVVITVNLLIDLLYGWVNPRIRHAR